MAEHPEIQIETYPRALGRLLHQGAGALGQRRCRLRFRTCSSSGRRPRYAAEGVLENLDPYIAEGRL
jgi:hypothetical protein